MASELGVGYISILPEVSKISPTVAAALNGLDPVADKSGQSMGGKLSAALGTTLKASVAGAGLAAGGVIATALSKGMGRLTGIENAQASLRGLGHDAESVQSIMDNALAAVSGTAFGLDAAAGVAASTVAAGIKPGEDLERTLKLVGDAATIAGVDMADMGRIVNQVATSDMMQMDDANQLMDAGIPILQMVGDEMGVTAAEARKLASDGKVSFETFQTALEKGVGGAALEAGNTFDGALSNMGAALGRVGATALEPFFNLSKDGFGAATTALDGLNAKLKPLAASTSEWLQETAVPGLAAFATNAGEAWDSFSGSAEVQSMLSQTGVVVSDLVETGSELAPVMAQAGSAIAKASAALGVGTWQLALVGLEGIGAAAKLATPPLEMITGLMNDHPSIVTAAVAAYAGFKTIPNVLEKISGLTSPMQKTTSEWGATVKDLKAYYASTGREISTFEAATQAMGMSSNKTFSEMGTALNNASVEGGKLNRTTSFLSAGFSGLKGAASGVMSLFGGPWGVALATAGVVVTSVVQANQKAEVAQQNMAAAARDSASAQTELRAAVAGTTGVLNEQAMAAAARVAGNELAAFTEQGKALDNWIGHIGTGDTAWYDRLFNTSSWQDYRQQMSDIKSASSELETAMKDLGIPVDDLNKVVAEGGPEYNALISHLRETGGSSDIAADQLEGARSVIEKTVKNARDLDPAFTESATAVEAMANAAGDADKKLSALNSILQAMGLAPKDAERAMRDASESINDVVEKAGSLADVNGVLGQSLIGVNGEIDTTTTNGQALFDQLDNLGQELQNVAANGGDAEGKFAEMQGALQVLADDFGLTKEQVLELGRGFGLVPRELYVALALDGADQAVKEIGDVWAAVEHLKVGDEPMRIHVESEEAQAAIESAGFSLEKIAGTEAEFKIRAEAEDAQGKLADLILMMGDLDGIEVSPEVLLNTDVLEGSAANAQAILDALNIQEPTPQAQLIIDQLLAGVDLSQGQLDYLTGLSAVPTADLQRDLFNTGISTSHGMLAALGADPSGKPILDANGQPLFNAVDQSKIKMNELKDKTVTITANTVFTSGFSGRGGASTWHTGGRIPAYAGGARHQGYRLPSSGPGTDRTDGFLAIDSSGVPIARLDTNEWVVNGRSSEKYNRALSLINRDDPSVQHLAKFADGGRVDSGSDELLGGRSAEEILSFARGESVGGHVAARSLEGAPYVWGGVNWGDCSGAIAALARFAVGLAPFAARFATMNQKESLESLGFAPGLGSPDDFNIGWFNGGAWGGHTSGSIGGTNVEMGGGRGNGQIGGGAAPASHPQYTDHAHLPLGSSLGSTWEALDPGSQWQSTGGDRLDSSGSSSSGASSSKKSSTPKSWSELAGYAAQTMVSGQVSNALGVFGISDSPGFLDAYGQWVDATTLEQEEQQRTMLKVDEEKIAKLEEDIRDAEDDLRIKRLKVGELKADASPSSRESANIAVTKAERKIDDLKSDLEEARKGKLHKVNDDGTLGSEVKDQVSASKNELAAQQKYDPNVQGLNTAINDAVLAVVGDRLAPSVLPKAVTDMLASIPAFRDGGWVSAPGGPQDDLGLARVSDSEFIVNAGAASRNRGLLELINAGGSPSAVSGGDTFNISGADPGEVIRRMKVEMMTKTMQMMGG
ncbi:tape measure protein [Corynebacterium callunae]|uniref:tape measure protein n=1 Tax=Corynebacterium callunae TaxID=1721 RepID=UPI001FFFA382|nr:tape measure protein [Corynebacterium callunae]MCK2200177.1 tape measure protein [Corynebacterium callunae]